MTIRAEGGIGTGTGIAGKTGADDGIGTVAGTGINIGIGIGIGIGLGGLTTGDGNETNRGGSVGT